MAKDALRHISQRIVFLRDNYNVWQECDKRKESDCHVQCMTYHRLYKSIHITVDMNSGCYVCIYLYIYSFILGAHVTDLLGEPVKASCLCLLELIDQVESKWQ